MTRRSGLQHDNTYFLPFSLVIFIRLHRHQEWWYHYYLHRKSMHENHRISLRETTKRIEDAIRRFLSGRVVRENEVDPLGFMSIACWADALVWETVVEHRFTLLAEAPGYLFWHFRFSFSW